MSRAHVPRDPTQAGNGLDPDRRRIQPGHRRAEVRRDDEQQGQRAEEVAAHVGQPPRRVRRLQHEDRGQADEAEDRHGQAHAQHRRCGRDRRRTGLTSHGADVRPPRQQGHEADLDAVLEVELLVAGVRRQRGASASPCLISSMMISHAPTPTMKANSHMATRSSPVAPRSRMMNTRMQAPTVDTGTTMFGEVLVAEPERAEEPCHRSPEEDQQQGIPADDRQVLQRHGDDPAVVAELRYRRLDAVDAEPRRGRHDRERDQEHADHRPGRHGQEAGPQWQVVADVLADDEAPGRRRGHHEDDEERLAVPAALARLSAARRSRRVRCRAR